MEHRSLVARHWHAFGHTRIACWKGVLFVVVQVTHTQRCPGIENCGYFRIEMRTLNNRRKRAVRYRSFHAGHFYCYSVLLYRGLIRLIIPWLKVLLPRKFYDSFIIKKKNLSRSSQWNQCVLKRTFARSKHWKVFNKLKSYTLNIALDILTLKWIIPYQLAFSVCSFIHFNEH